MSAHRIRPINVDDKPRPSAQYIGELTRELARLARTDGCETLSYLLELATIEAELMGGLPEGQKSFLKVPQSGFRLFALPPGPCPVAHGAVASN